MSDEIEKLDPLPDIDEINREVTVAWLPILQRISINLFVPFINGIMLGFGEILAHELGLNFGWRSARVYDPNAFPATNPRLRRKWLFGLW